MAERIGSTPVRYPFSFVVARDSGAWPDPTADGIYSQLLRRVARIEPAPVFFANLGDFAGPGTPDRHEHHLRLVEGSQSRTSAGIGVTGRKTEHPGKPGPSDQVLSMDAGIVMVMALGASRRASEPRSRSRGRVTYGLKEEQEKEETAAPSKGTSRRGTVPSSASARTPDAGCSHRDEACGSREATRCP